jgi:hypothetical protein
MLRLISSTASALALTASVFAQEPAPASPQSEQLQTLTGCVVEAKTTDGGKAYVLNNAEGGTATMYVLAGASQSDVVATNVNKKVEVTGPVQQPSAPPAEDTAAANPKVLRPPLMDVESVKVVADTCK